MAVHPEDLRDIKRAAHDGALEGTRAALEDPNGRFQQHLAGDLAEAKENHMRERRFWVKVTLVLCGVIATLGGALLTLKVTTSGNPALGLAGGFTTLSGAITAFLGRKI